MEHARLIELFCSKEQDPNSIHTKYNKPYRYNGHTYFTNGHIAARIPGEFEGDGDGEAAKHPATIDKYLAEPVTSRYIDAADIELDQEYIKKLEAYEASEPVLAKCGDCDGTGEAVCSCCGQDTDCDVCGGLGELDMREVPDGNKPVLVLGWPFAQRYIARVQELPNAKIAIRSAANGMHATAHVTFDGGEAFLMGVLA